MWAQEQKKLKSKKKGIIQAVCYIVAIVAAAFIWNGFFFSPLKVIGDSMNPALSSNDLVIINKISYTMNGAKRFDMVVFPYRYDNSYNYIKRVIGLPGETVEIVDGKIYIDGSELEEYYGIHDKTTEMRYKNYGPVTLEDDEYFVMGDNRDHSDDSRSPDVGPVNEDDIIGTICFRMWPFESIGSLEYQ